MLADLKDLPTRKDLQSVTIQAHALHYVCTHDTEPPQGQIICTDQSTTALLRIVKKRDATSAVLKKGGEAKEPSHAKRPLDVSSAEVTDERPLKKQQKGATATAAPGASAPKPSGPSTFTADELKAKTVPQLKELLKARGLAVSGTKDELIRRIVDYQRANKYK